MNIKKTTLCSAMAVAMGSASMGALADLTTSAVLEFDDGVINCVYGGTPPSGCTAGITDVTTGSFFSMDANGSGSVETSEKVPITMKNGVHIGTIQSATGSHSGAPTGGEGGNIDNGWEFFTNTGLHQTTSPITASGSGTTMSLDFSGWNVTWNGIPSIPMGGDAANFSGDTGIATIVCSQASCSASSTFTLDYNAHVPLGDASGFGGVPYALHMTGHVGTSAIPVPAAVWLFGSGLLGLVGVARRKKSA